MEAQMHRPHSHGEEQHDQHGGLHSVEGDGQGEHHHEKKSVIKKVKAKAKKIKDSITHGLSHEHELEHGHGVHDHDEEDEDEEMVQDPEVHGAPIYESSVIRSATVPQQDVGVGPKANVNLENPTSRGEDRIAGDQGNARLFLQSQEYAGQAGKSLSEPTAVEAHMPGQRHMTAPASGTYSKASDQSNVQGQEGNIGEPVARLGAPAGLEEDPHAPKDFREEMQPSNYQSKVTDPTGQRGEAAGIDPLVFSLGKMSVKEDETKTSPKAQSEQKSYTGSHDQFAPQAVSTDFQFAPKPIPHKASEGPEDPEIAPKHFDSTKPEDMLYDPGEGYSDKISSAASALTDKAISAKDAVSSKLGYGGTEGPEFHEMHEGEHTDVKPSEQSSDTDKITSATSAIATKATTAKDVIASKLGFGGSEDTTLQGTEAGKGSVKSVSPRDYVHKAAASVTETLAPVYGKVAGVGSLVMSKVPGTGKEQEGSAATAQVSHGGKGSSMKEYFAEKFAPGEEDKALSEVISDKLHWQKERTGELRAMDKVMESEEVAKRLGTGKENQREGDDAVIAGSESSGAGVVDRIKEAVTSWIGKGGESQTFQGSPSTAFVNAEGSST